MFMTFSDSSTEQMKKLKFLCGYRDYDELIQEKLKDNVITLEDLRKAVDYIKVGRKTDVKVERAKAIVKFLTSLINGADSKSKEEFLRVKIFCEEYVK